jgi:hypothetical protein
MDVSLVADGTSVTINANHSDASGNPSIQAAASVLKDTSAPTVAVTSAPVINISNENPYTVAGTCSENGENVSVSVGGISSTVSCTLGGWSTSVNATGLAQGAVTVTADHTDVAGNPATQGTLATSKDTVAPTVAITSSPAINAGTANAYIVSGTCSENSRAVSVNVGGVTSSPSCSGGNWTATVNVSGVADGSVAITADHTDASGNPALQATASVTKDTTPPTVAITSSPIINIANAGSYTVAGSCSENGQSVAIVIGTVSTSATCTTLAWTKTVYVSTVVDAASVTITANHSDVAGNTAPQASTTVLKDTIAPTVAITSSPAIKINNVNPYGLSGTCSEEGQTVSVSVGGLTATPSCSSGNWSASVNATSLGQGSVALTADITDTAGNPATQATTSVTKDTVAPIIAITSSPAINIANVATYTVGGTCSENGEVITVSVGGLPDAPICTAGNWSTTVNATTLAEGSVSITADMNDAVGNPATQATASVVKDTIAPTVAITSSPDIKMNNVTAYTVSGSCSENGRTVTVSVGGISSTPSCGAGAWSATVNASALGQGSVAITADTTDAVGNPATQATASVTKDTVAPTVAINAPAIINTFNENPYPVSGTCSENGQTVSVNVGGQTATPGCVGGNWSATVDASSLAQGSVAITADTSDVVGNPATQANATATKDTIAPTVAITSSPAITIANVNPYTLSGTCSENGQTVNVDVGGQTATPSCTAGNWSTTVNASGLAQGSVAITADITDTAGNLATQATASVTKDTVAPTVAINPPGTINILNVGSYPLSGTCSENGQTVNVNVGGVTATPSCAGGNWSATIDANPVAQGSVSVTADHNDALGNPATQATTSVTKDTVAPTVTITSPVVINNANKTTYSVSGTCSENTQNVNVNIGGLTSSPACTAGAWSVTNLDVSGLADGSVAITADHTDAAANAATQATASATKDTSNPNVAITTFPAINNLNKASYTFGGSCSEAGRTVSIAAGTVTTTQSCSLSNDWSVTVDVSGLADGSVALTADHSDAAGNVATQATQSVTKDTAAPTVALDAYLPIKATTAGAYALTGTCSENGQAVVVTVGSASDSPLCAGGNWAATLDTTLVADNAAVSITVNHSDAVGNPATPVSASVLKDTVVPTVSIASHPVINNSNQLLYTISGSCSETGQAVNVNVGSATGSDVCTLLTWSVTLDVSGEPDGASVSITASHSDAAGNNALDITSSGKDTALPTVLITSFPDINLGNVNPYPVSGTCSEVGEAVNVSVGGFTTSFACSGTNTWAVTVDARTLPEGTVAITADHSDTAGNPAVQATKTVNKDATAPTVAITSAATINVGNKTTYSLSGTCSEDTRTVAIMVGSTSASPACSSGNWSVTNLDVSGNADGTVTITANHTDAAGNAAIQASTTVTKDTSNPTVAITNPGPIKINNVSAYAVSGSCSEEGRNVSVNIGGLGNTLVCTTGAWTITIDVSSLGEGSVSITADHDDVNGNTATQASISVTKDTIAPTVAITAPAVINSFNVGTYSVGGTCSENGRTVSVAVGSVTSSDVCTAGNWSVTVNATPLADGSVTITANISDTVGNPAPQASASATKDTAAPMVAVTSAADIIISNVNPYPVSGTCSENGQTVTVSVGGIGTTTPCTAGNTWSTTVNATPLAQGPVAITADITDVAGNPAPQGTASVTKDTVAPTVAITSSPTIRIANVNPYPVSGTCSENGRTVTVSVGGVTATPSCTAGLTWSTTVNASSLAEGSVTITANHTDTLGNSATPASVSVTKDTVAPTVTIDVAGNINSGNATTYSLSGTCSESGVNVSVAVGSATATPSCTAGAWSVSNLDVSSNADGTVTITANHTDAAGNSATTASTTVTKDATIPTVAITSSPNIKISNVASYTVAGTCSESTRIVTVVIGSLAAVTPTCSAGNTWTTTVNATTLGQGSVTITANHTDAAGNSATTASTTVTKDTVAPTVTINAPANINFTNSTNYSLSGTCSENGNTVSVAVGSTTASPSCLAGAWSVSGLNVSGNADGTVTITANHNDTIGNPATTASTTVSKDATIPTVAITSAPAYIKSSNVTSYTVSGTCSENTRTVTVSVGGIGATPSCTGGAWTATVNATALSQGSVTITADHTDAAGNSATQASTSVTKDTVAPTVAITTAAPIRAANVNSYSVSGTCSDNGQTVNVTVGAASNTATCSTGTWTISNWNVSAVPDAASVTVTANHSDVAGNAATLASTSVWKDTVDAAPVATLTSISNFNEEATSVVTLTYTDSENDLATACAITATSKVSVTQACVCNGAGVCTVGITGNTDQTGAASFTYRVTANGANSATSTVNFSLNAVNDAPVLSAIANQTIAMNGNTGALGFTYTDVDSPTICNGTRLSMTSSNTTLVPVSNVSWAGTAPNCSATITPVAAKGGSATITVVATDASGAQGTSSFVLTVNGSTIILRTVAGADFTSYSFPDPTPVGSTVTFRAYNDGNVPTGAVTISYTQAQTNASTQSTDCSTGIPGNSFCTITVTFDPTSGPHGAKTATVKVTDGTLTDTASITGYK